MREVRPIAIDDPFLAVSASLSNSLLRACKNGWTDWGFLWGGDLARRYGVNEDDVVNSL